MGVILVCATAGLVAAFFRSLITGRVHGAMGVSRGEQPVGYWARVVLIGAAAALLGWVFAPRIRVSDLTAGAGVLVGLGMGWTILSKLGARSRVPR